MLNYSHYHQNLLPPLLHHPYNWHYKRLTQYPLYYHKLMNHLENLLML